MNILDTVNSPSELKRLGYLELEQYCAEVREFLIQNVAATGGHLSSNLGVVEFTVAWHKIMNSPIDTLVFDVGHQCYTHKIITGRKDKFAQLRSANGLSGFPNPRESEHDAFVAGHGSTSISAAIGIAQAKKLRCEPGIVMALIGDGAFTGGLVYEAMNNIEGLDNLIVVLNDNKMSISKNDSSVAQYFTKLRTSQQYHKAKIDVKNLLDNTPVIGHGMVKSIQSMKALLRRSIYHSTFFEEMGFQYIGPLDGHNLLQLCNLFSMVKYIDKPLLIHIETTKGKGFAPAEKNPGAFHGVGAFDTRHVADPDFSPADSFSNVFGHSLAQIGSRNNNICAVTAAMKYGTGLHFFKKQNRKRFFDVGMAEAHAVTFAAGLARKGMLPVVAIYSTFLQRAYDQIIHDVMLQNLNVLFAIDRAGLVPGDGETHQGIYDAAFLSQQSTMPIVSVGNYAELTFWLEKLLQEYSTPRALRYPRGKECDPLSEKACTGNLFDVVIHHENATVAIVTYGSETNDAIIAANILATENIWIDVVQLVMINPLPEDFIVHLCQYSALIFAEEGVRCGGIGEHTAVALLQAGYKGSYVHKAVPETGIDHATVTQLREQFELDAESLAEAVKKVML